MCINNYRNLMRIKDEMHKGIPPGLLERFFTGFWQKSGDKVSQCLRAIFPDFRQTNDYNFH